MLTDLKLINNDISFDQNDIQLINDDDCIKQDITSQLNSSFNTTFYDPLYGSSFLNFIQETLNENTLDLIKQNITIILQDHPNIINNSIEIDISSLQPLTIEMSFTSMISNNKSTTLTYIQETSF